MNLQSARQKQSARSRPSLKVEGAGAFLGAFAPDHSHVLQLASDLTGGLWQKSAADVASEGFSGTGESLPFRSEMEESFGADFSSVRVYKGAPARKANEALGARAYTMGHQIAFKEQPSKSLVAHELTHVIQQSQTPAAKSEDGAIDSSGEGLAEAVEAAVAGGRDASDVLPVSLPRVARAPARKGRGRPARAGGQNDPSRFTMGMTFSKEAFEKSYEYTIWNKSMSWPTPVPGVNFMIDPSVKVAGKLGVGYGGKRRGRSLPLWRSRAKSGSGCPVGSRMSRRCTPR